MSFCQYFFGKEIDQVEFQDVSNFIVNRSDLEKTFLECKSCDNLKLKPTDYIPSIVGFLNTGGGLLIIGTPIEEGNPRVFQSTFKFHSYIPKDHMRDKLIDAIQPLPNGIQIEIIGKDDQCVTLVDVPKSEYPPHQYKGTYYIRLDGSRKAAPHAFVEALFNRRKPRYQQALIEHFERKIADFRQNEEAMTALYFLVLESRAVPEPIIYAAVLGTDYMKTQPDRVLTEDLSTLSNRGVLISENIQEDRSYYDVSHHNYWKHSINPDCRDMLADLVFERHRRKKFHLHDV